MVIVKAGSERLGSKRRPFFIAGPCVIENERHCLKIAERLAAVGQTVAGMAHCVKNILHGLRGGSYMVNIGIDKNNTEKLKTGWKILTNEAPTAPTAPAGGRR